MIVFVKKYYSKLGIICMLCSILFLLGCTSDEVQENSPPLMTTQETDFLETDKTYLNRDSKSDNLNENAGEIFTVQNIYQEDDIVIAHLIIQNHSGDIEMFIDLNIETSVEIEYESYTVEGTVDDIMVGDFLRIYTDSGEISPALNGTINMSTLNKIVILR